MAHAWAKVSPRDSLPKPWTEAPSRCIFPTSLTGSSQAASLRIAQSLEQRILRSKAMLRKGCNIDMRDLKENAIIRNHMQSFRLETLWETKCAQAHNIEVNKQFNKHGQHGLVIPFSAILWSFTGPVGLVLNIPWLVCFLSRTGQFPFFPVIHGVPPI